MQKLVSLLFRVAFQPLVRVSTAALSPIFADLALDTTQISALVAKVSLVMQAKPVTFEVMGIYSAAQQQEIVEGVAQMLVAILADFGITESTSDIGRLLDEVSKKVLV